MKINHLTNPRRWSANTIRTIMNIEEIDLSYSGLSSLIDQDKDKGIQVLIAITKAIDDQQCTVDIRKSLLLESERVLNSLRSGLENALKWTKAERPINLFIDNSIFAVNNQNEVKKYTITNL